VRSIPTCTPGERGNDRPATPKTGDTRRRGHEPASRAKLVEILGVFITSINSPPLATGGHEHTVPARWRRATHGVAAPFGVLHHAEAEARRGPGDIGDMDHTAHLGTQARVTGWREGRSAVAAPDL